MGWNKLSDGLPPIGYPLIVTIFDSCRNRRELRYPVYYQKGIYSGNYGFYVNGIDYLMPEYSEVLTWMKVPNVYEGETE